MLNCWCITWPVGFKRLNLCLLYDHRKVRRNVSCSQCCHRDCSCCWYFLQHKGKFLSVSVKNFQHLRQRFVHLPWVSHFTTFTCGYTEESGDIFLRHRGGKSVKQRQTSEEPPHNVTMCTLSSGHQLWHGVVDRIRCIYTGDISVIGPSQPTDVVREKDVLSWYYL